MGAPIPLEKRRAILAALEDPSRTRQSVADEFGVGIATVGRLVRKAREQTSLAPKAYTRGPKPKIGGEMLEFLLIRVREEPELRHYDLVCELKRRFDVDVSEPCWLALRTPPPSTPKDPEFQRKTPLNEYGRELFSHTSAIYVTVGGKEVFHLEDAKNLLDQTYSNHLVIL